MQINKHSSRKNILVGAIIIMLLAIGGISAYYFMNTKHSTDKINKETRPNNSVDYQPATDEQKKSGEQAKSDFLDRQEKGDGAKVQTPGISSISISNVSSSEDILQVRTTIMSATGGKCKLILSRQGETSILREAGTQSLGSYDTCMGFDIDTTGLEKGTWNLSLYYTGDPAGVVAAKSVEIQ